MLAVLLCARRARAACTGRAGAGRVAAARLGAPVRLQEPGAQPLLPPLCDHPPQGTIARVLLRTIECAPLECVPSEDVPSECVPLRTTECVLLLLLTVLLRVINHRKAASSAWWNYRHYLHHAKPNIAEVPNLTPEP